ncbi:MAG: diacylglycerol kinase family protein [Hyphomonadaceae bacterium]
MEPLAIDAAPAARGQTRRPLPATDAKALIIFNAKAGSVAPGDEEKLIDAVRAAGIDKFALVGPEKLTEKLLRRARDFDVIIVLGGDGTARSVAELAPRDGPPMILLPGGTLNVLPRALYGERPWPEALKAALERGVVRRLAAGKADGSPFFVAAIFGAPTLFARAREAAREGRWLTAIRRFRFFTQRAFARSLRARPGRDRAQRAAAVGVLCPSFSGEVAGDTLEWVRLDASSLVDLARVSLRALGDGWRKDETIEIAQCKHGDIVSLGVIPAVLDGEPKTFVSRVHISYDPKGPRVIVVEDEEA